MTAAAVLILYATLFKSLIADGDDMGYAYEIHIGKFDSGTFVAIIVDDLNAGGAKIGIELFSGIENGF